MSDSRTHVGDASKHASDALRTAVEQDAAEVDGVLRDDGGDAPRTEAAQCARASVGGNVGEHAAEQQRHERGEDEAACSSGLGGRDLIEPVRRLQLLEEKLDLPSKAVERCDLLGWELRRVQIGDVDTSRTSSETLRTNRRCSSSRDNQTKLRQHDAALAVFHATPTRRFSRPLDPLPLSLSAE